jgi:hypothetical protein
MKTAASFAHTAVLPPLNIGGHSLNIFCDLTRPQGIEELLAAMTAWLELSDMAPAQVEALMEQGVNTEDAWYDVAMQRFRQALRRHSRPAAASAAVARLKNEFFDKHTFPELDAALSQYFLPEPFDGQPTQAPGRR